jgi:hypothetical protein
MPAASSRGGQGSYGALSCAVAFDYINEICTFFQKATVQNTLYKIQYKIYVLYMIHEAQNLYYLYTYTCTRTHIHSYICIKIDNISSCSCCSTHADITILAIKMQ